MESNPTPKDPKEQFLEKPVDDEAYKTVSPTPESAKTDTLESNYDELNYKVADMIGREWYIPRWEGEAEDGMEAIKIRYNAGVDLLYLFAYQSQDESRPVAERQVWADEFTKQSIDLYGQPDPDLAKIIDAGGGEMLIERYQPTMEVVKNWLLDKYKNVFEALDLDSTTEELLPDDIYRVFNDGLNALKSEDSRWNEWKVEVKPSSTVLSCESANKTIFVGDKRPPVKPAKLKGLFAHEVLRHALTAVNGENIGIASALPRYIAAEEGFAKLFELSISGETPKVSMNNYADMAFALGQLDGQKHTRSEVIERKLSRKKLAGKVIDEKNIREATNSANRLFRGTPGNDEVSGVFTKDVSYFGGFIPAVEFIERGLKYGKSMDEIIEFANAAKFDPNDPLQKEYIESKIADRYLPKEITT